ncbi:MAG: hypothetical protein RR500_01985 [Bacilli bacterium]
MSVYTIVMIIFTIVLATIYVLRILLTSYYQKQFVRVLETVNEEEFNELYNNKIVKYVIPPFNLEYMKLNLYLIENKKKQIDSQFEFLLSMKKSKMQDKEIMVKSFNYYVKLRDKKRCSGLLIKIKECGDQKTIEESVLLYDIYILQKSSHIEKLLENLEDMSLTQRSINEYLIALQYENEKEMVLSKKYFDLSKEHIKCALTNEK